MAARRRLRRRSPRPTATAARDGVAGAPPTRGARHARRRRTAVREQRRLEQAIEDAEAALARLEDELAEPERTGPTSTRRPRRPRATPPPSARSRRPTRRSRRSRRRPRPGPLALRYSGSFRARGGRWRRSWPRHASWSRTTWTAGARSGPGPWRPPRPPRPSPRSTPRSGPRDSRGTRKPQDEQQDAHRHDRSDDHRFPAPSDRRPWPAPYPAGRPATRHDFFTPLRARAGTLRP